MPDIMSAVDIAAEFRDELARLDAAVVDVMLGQWRQVETALIADMEAFAARFEPGQSLTPGQVLRMERYQALQAQVTAQLTALEGAAGPLITAGQNQAAGLGALQAATTLDSLGVGLTFNQLSTKATQNIIALARAGKPLAELLQPMYGAASEGIIRELINGVALGYGPRKIARNMARDGMTDALNHLLLVSRDQYNRAARTAAFQRYEDSGVVRGYTRRCARQAGRTCIACIALDGKFYPLSVPFFAHPQCRCTAIPAVRGVDMQSRLGSGQSWFEGLDEDAQIATMGRGRWEAWKAGELPWDKMAVKTNHPVWGPGVRVANVPGGGKRGKSLPETRIKPKSVPVFDSTKDAERWAIDRGLAGAVDYSKLPVDVANEANRALSEYYDEYGIKLERIGYRKNMDLYDNLMEVKRGRSAIIENGEIVGWRDSVELRINPVFFNNPNASQILRQSHEAGWAYSENVFDLITHEYGHILTNVDDAYFLARPGIIKTVSTYGQSSNSETIAELFLKSRKVGLGNLTDEEAQFLNQYIGG